MQTYAAGNRLPIDIVAYPDVMNDAADALKHSHDLRQPLPHRRRQAHDRRLAAGQDGLARPALLRPAAGTTPPTTSATPPSTNDQAMDAVDDALQEQTTRSSPTPMARPRSTCSSPAVREATAKYGNPDRRPCSDPRPDSSARTRWTPSRR